MKELKRFFLRIFFVVELVIFGALYFFGTQGMQAVVRLKREDKALQKKIVALKQEVTVLQDELIAWKTNSFYKEKVAREQLQMAKEGETIYYVS